jgi:hypothetical protein
VSCTTPLSFPRKRESSSRRPVDPSIKLATSSHYWMPACAGMTNVLPRCTRHPGFDQLPLRHEGGGAPKSANLMVSTSVAGGGGRLSARHSRRLLRDTPGPAFRCRLWPVSQPAPGGDSYWSRGEPRCRPSAQLASRTRGRRAPSRFMTPHERALQRTRWVECKGGLGSGDKERGAKCPELLEHAVEHAQCRKIVLVAICYP